LFNKKWDILIAEIIQAHPKKKIESSKHSTQAPVEKDELPRAAIGKY
jgi:hypothetical protein